MSKLKQLFSTPKKAALAAACVLVFLGTVGACVAYALGAFSGSSPGADAIGGENAQRFAFADAGVDPVDANVLSVRYKRFQDTFVYEVEFIAGSTQYVYQIDAADGSVKGKESKTVKGPEDSSSLPNSIPLEDAREIALTDAGLTQEQATFLEVEQSGEGGASVYRFRFYAGNVEYEYEINAQTGVIYSKNTVTYIGQGSSAPTAPPAQSTAPDPSDPPAQNTPAAQDSRPPAVATDPPRPSGGLTPPTGPVDPFNSSGPSQSSGGQDRVTLEGAKRTALSDAGVAAADAHYTRARLGREDGVTVYEIEFYTATHEYEYKINAASGSVYSKSVQLLSSDPAPENSRSGGGFLGAAEIRAICLDHAGCTADQVTFSEVELDENNGMTIYEVEFYKDGVKYEYTLDAFSGEILEYEWEH